MRKLPIRTMLWAVPVLMVGVAVLPLLADDFDGNVAEHRAKQTAPIEMGTSGGSINDRSSAFCCGGTLGSLVNYQGTVSILSNNHVIARSGSATAGEDIIQPGLIDVGCNGGQAQVIGDFAGNIVPLGTGNVDAAIATARSNVNSTGEIIDIGVPCTNVVDATVNMGVAKSGRTTGTTFGTVQSINLDVSIQYQAGCGRGKKFTATFNDQVSITPGSFSAGGDSGSLIVTNNANHNPTALLFAGSSSITVGNQARDVVAAFGGSGSFGWVGNNCLLEAPTGSDQINRGPSANDVEFARVIKERYKADLFARPGVVGVGVGATEEDPTEPAIIVYVLAGPAERPQGFPAELDGVKVRVIPTDPIVARQECAE